ncbi:putative spliced leader RNA PSE-promoter transcription factor [Trypanosoma theileri]|uniref:Putative spliced leader RNA PSE-promoter transcription factor n=1 Tax=Trypanosoma theileri TaxID=67003 RepID=A0A1X0NZN4_9TRYP|nr:putative spliced leader RNA PSE-promoter transcription factor [Trypanosoma theileri]ORC89610.1 putative spliced leader RNA PSE-promoter transcription factor [Trypanosoma theileri]
MMSVGSKILAAVRDAMQQHAIGALIVPSSDPHNSEYVKDEYKCRAYISNFNGSAGTCLITMDQAYLWTDGRYWMEASQALYPEWQLMKDGYPGVPTLEEWIQTNLGTKTPVGMNSFLSTVAEWERRRKSINLVAIPEIVQPLMPKTEKPPVKLFVRPEEFCGVRCEEKVATLVEELERQKCDAMVLSALDEIAWVTNLRGADIPFNPVFYAYALVQSASPRLHLFVDPAKLPEDGLPTTTTNGEPLMELHPYDGLEAFIGLMPNTSTFLVDEYQTSQHLYSMLETMGIQTKRVKCGPAQKLKAIKNKVEIEGFRRCHVRDGVALTRYLAWLHDAVAVKGETNINEYDAAVKLESFRREGDYFVQPSFTTISSVGPNAAIVHYAPPQTGSATIVRDQIYLVDSGAQYLDGTTDVTRTVCFQTPRPEEREAYTLVLKGNLALHTAVWPTGTSGHRLDVLARTALWRVGLNYAHGTGHGVGSFLNVHEGPQGIGARPTPTEATLAAGMIMSNEPGYYKDGSFGIRIENLELIVPTPTLHSAEGFLTFDTLTMAPLCRELIDADALTSEERQMVDSYHRAVREAITPQLIHCNDNCALAYLNHHTAPL